MWVQVHQCIPLPPRQMYSDSSTEGNLTCCTIFRYFGTSIKMGGYGRQEGEGHKSQVLPKQGAVCARKELWWDLNLLSPFLLSACTFLAVTLEKAERW